MGGQRTIADVKLLGGHPALDFVNTVDARRDRWGPDFLQTYGDIVTWADRVQLVSGEEAAALTTAALDDPSAADAALLRARASREGLYEVFLAEAQERAPADAAVEVLQHSIRAAAPLRILQQVETGFQWAWASAENLDDIGGRVVLVAAELLAGRSNRRLVRECTGPNCGWLFLDTSRGGRRRWCSDETCGTHDRVRRFRGKG
jgi:predicted RNA-binding Zn ribbon-like protein